MEFSQVFIFKPLPPCVSEVVVDEWMKREHQPRFLTEPPVSSSPSELEHISFNLDKLPEAEREHAAKYFVRSLDSFPQLCSLHTPCFLQSFFPADIFAKLTIVTVDSIGVSDAVALLDGCTGLQTATLKSMYRGYHSPPPPPVPSSCWIRDRPRLRSLVVFAQGCHFMDLLQFFRFSSLDKLVVTKYNPDDEVDEDSPDRGFGDFLDECSLSDLRTICIGDYGGDLEPLRALLDVLTDFVDIAQEGEQTDELPMYFSFLKTFAIPKLVVDPTDLEDVVKSISSFAVDRADQVRPLFGLESVSVSINCPDLLPCHTCHLLKPAIPCNQCPEASVDLSGFQKCIEEGVRKVHLKINDKVLFSVGT